LIFKNPLVKSFFGLGAIRLLSIPLGLVTSIILARSLGTEAFGQYSFVMSLVAILALPISGGLPQLLTREVAAYLHEKKWSLYRGVLRIAHLWVLISSLAIISIYFIIANSTNLLPVNSKWQLLAISIFTLPFLGLGAVRNGAIKGLAKPVYSEIPSQLIQPLLVISAYLTLAKLDILNAKMAVTSQLVVAIIVFLIASWIFHWLQPLERKFETPEYDLKVWVPSLLPFTLLALIGTFNTQIGIVVLGFLGSDEQVAAMRVADRGAAFVALSLTLINIVIAPHIVRAFRSKDRKGLQKLAKQSARGSFLIALPIGLVLLFGGKYLIELVFGADYVIAYFPMAILVIGQLINVFFGSVGYLLSMSGYTNDTLKGQLIAVLVNIVLCSLLVPLYGAAGAAIGVSLSIVVWNCVLSLLLYKRLKVNSFAV